MNGNAYSEKERGAVAEIVRLERQAQRIHDELRKTRTEESIIFQLHVERERLYHKPEKRTRWTKRETAFAAQTVLEHRLPRWLYYRLGGTRTYPACIGKVQELRYMSRSRVVDLAALAEGEDEKEVLEKEVLE